MIQPHFLQGQAWESFQNNLGRQTFRASGNGWQWLAILERGHLGSRLYCPYGPTIETKPALQEAMLSLRKKAAETKVDFIRIEPRGVPSAKQLEAAGAVRAVRNVQPANTWQVDLGQTEDDILGAVTSGNRRSFKQAAERGMTFRVSYNPADIHLFLDCIHEVSRRTGMQPHSDNYFQVQAETLFPTQAAALLIVDVNGQPAASCIVYDSPTTRFYAHAGAHYALRKEQPSASLVCFAMLDAKARGKQIFDFYGIAPPNQPDHPWAGVTAFKQSFGGYAVDYVGTWEIPLHKNRYHMIRMAHKVNSAKQSAVQLQRKLLK